MTPVRRWRTSLLSRISANETAPALAYRLLCGVPGIGGAVYGAVVAGRLVGFNPSWRRYVSHCLLLWCRGCGVSCGPGLIPAPGLASRETRCVAHSLVQPHQMVCVSIHAAAAKAEDRPQNPALGSALAASILLLALSATPPLATQAKSCYADP